MSIDDNYKKNFWSDPSLFVLLISNLITIGFAALEGWNLRTVMLVYWFQSVIIGIFNFIRILELKEFSVEGVLVNGRPARNDRKMKIETAFFFLFHYGFFHLGYLIFILFNDLGQFSEEEIGFGNIKFIYLSALIFFLNHLYSYIYNKPKDTKKQNIGTLMAYPYFRIIPMQVTLLFGSTIGVSGTALLLFLLLKTASDAAMHIVEHKIIRKAQEPTN